LAVFSFSTISVLICSMGFFTESGNSSKRSLSPKVVGMRYRFPLFGLIFCAYDNKNTKYRCIMLFERSCNYVAGFIQHFKNVFETFRPAIVRVWNIVILVGIGFV